ncbi:hypothetical protein SCLCIDRAFT_1217597 [Scleroderma citrinum Foug A]|uniref:Uncharacterized protein n=1 Tax=Scleroderma citrinum Foug A TaxID=1036808 RepID=A0A0C3DUN6_9AGAM|nr:hypothetical protein SCLCIDRAFT_1217597 [Scleroderma citrinum Foug A]
MELMDPDEFIKSLSAHMPKGKFPSTEDDRLGTFPITNRGIQIWLFLRPVLHSVFQAWLPCRSDPLGPPVTINLGLWESNYYRYPQPVFPPEGTLQFRQVYLRYQDTSYQKVTFEINDSAIAFRRNFTYRRTYPVKYTEDMFTLTSTDPLCIKVYSNDRTGHCLAVGIGQCFGKDWIHVAFEESRMWDSLWMEYAQAEYSKMLASAPEYARSMEKARSGAGGYGRACIMQSRLCQRTLRTSCVVWKRPRKIGVKFDFFRDPALDNVSGEWMGFDVDVGGLFRMPAYHFRISIDITVHRTQMIPTVTGGLS